MAAGSLVQQYCEETTCSICLEYFTDPVTTQCGHNFCRACLTQSWRGLGRTASCPECRAPVQQSSLRPNRKLANIADISKTCSLQQAKGGDCQRHQEPLKLFCKDDEALICVVCVLLKEHREHHVIPAEEAAKDYKERIQAQLLPVRLKRELFVRKKMSEQKTSQNYLRELKAEKQEITSVFEQMHKYLQETEHFWLTELADVEKEIKNKQEEYVTKLSEEISQFDNLIKEIKLKCQQPPSELLQDISCTMSRCQEEQEKTPPALSLRLEWSLRSNLQKSAILKKTLHEFKGLLRRAENTAVNVTLDSDTAHPRLILSQDLKSVFCEGVYQKQWDKPERFDVMPFVLGSERFTSGKFFWEVEALKEKGWWAVGVARESICRKGFIRVSPNVGIWAVANDSVNPHQVWALTSPNHTHVALRSRLKNIRVFLDYKKGHVKFFNADTEDLIYTYSSASFSGERVRPFFWMEEGGCLQC